MPGTELLDESAPRAELDRRSREARLRLERVERLLVVRLLRRQSLLRRMLYCLRSRIYLSGQTEDQSAEATQGGTPMGRWSQAPSETGGAAGGSSTAPSASWPHCTTRERQSLYQSDCRILSPWPDFDFPPDKSSKPLIYHDN